MSPFGTGGEFPGSGSSGSSSLTAGLATIPSAIKYPYLHRALAAASAGNNPGDRKISLLGDSIMYGFHDSAGIGSANVVAKILNGSGYPSALGFAIPNNFQELSVDPRWTVGAGWSDITNEPWSFGGTNPAYIGTNGAGANTLKFTPSGGYSYDTFDVWFIRNTGFGTIQVNIDGGANTPIVTSGAAGIAKVTVTGAASTAHVLNLGTITVGNVVVVGIEPSLSTISKLRIANQGVYGTTTTQWTNTVANTGFGPLDAIKAYAADVWIIDLIINDILTSIPLATSIANLQTIINACRNTPSDVFLMTPVPTATTTIPAASEIAASAAMKSLAAANSCGVIDVYTRWGNGTGYATLNPLGYYYDTIHPSFPTGYSDIGAALAQGLLTA